MSEINDALEYRLTGGAANADASLSLGGEISSIEIVNSSDHNLFTKVDDAEALAGSKKYRCIELYNAGATTITDFGLYIGSATPSSFTKIYIGLGSSGVNGEEQLIADEDTAPSDVTFAHPLNEASSLDLPDLPAGQHINIWIRRDVTVGAEGALSDYVRLIPKGTP